jgi:hypothetical protein
MPAYKHFLIEGNTPLWEVIPGNKPAAVWDHLSSAARKNSQHLSSVDHSQYYDHSG